MISATIVLFNPDLDKLKENIDAVLPQVDHLFLVDNAPKNFDFNILSSWYDDASNISKIQYLPNDSNRGIAYALNRGIEAAKKSGDEWILTLDQDSVIPRNLVSGYMRVISDHTKCGIVTCQVDYNGVRQETVQKADETVDFAITSGSLLNIQACYEIGGYDESMFIDGVDFEYCFRLRANGYSIIRAGDVLLKHELGDLKIVSFLGKKISVENHNAFRTYYISRNYIYCDRKHKGYYGKYQCLTNEAKLITKVLLFEKGKFKKLKSILQGIWAGLHMGISDSSYLV